MAGLINLLNAAKYYKGLGGQVKAFEYLDSVITEEQRLKFQDLYRTNIEPEKPKGDVYIYVKWSGKYDEYGCKVFGMYLMNGDVVVDKIACTSGQDYAQDVVWPTEDTSGSMRPCPEGIYDIGAVDDLGYDPGASDGYGQWVYPLEPRAKIQRSLIRVHSDRNRATSPGSAGCLCPYTIETMLKFVTWQRMKARPTYLVMDHELGFLKQKQNFIAPDITKKPSPSAEAHQPVGGSEAISKDVATAIFLREPTDEQMADLNRCMQMFDINTPQRKRHFLSQIAHESGGLKHMKEIGDHAYFTENYEDRDDLGNIHAGDGAKFAGVGPIQTTGRSNYARLAKVVGDPKILELGQDYTAEHYAFIASGVWWADNKMNELCDRPDVTVEMVSRMVNCGGNPKYKINGLADRIECYKRACEVI